MNTIQIVTNSDRCHVSVNSRPVATFLYSNYSNNTDEWNKQEAIQAAKAHVFDVISEHNQQGLKFQVYTDIAAK